MEFNPQEIAQKELTPIQDLTQQIRTSVSSPAPKLGSMMPEFESSSISLANDYKPSLTNKNYNIEDAYAPLPDGSMIKRFDTYMAGRDNAEYAAQTQSTADKWINGSTKWLAKTGLAIVGGTVGTVYGAEQGLEKGSLNAVYDNDFSNWLADLDTKLNYQLPNYYSKQEQDLGLLGQAGTANFWADKVLGGLSFTAGAIVSEGIWAWATGGTSLATAGARWGSKALGFTKSAKALKTYKDIVKAPLNQMYKTGKISKSTAIGLGQAGEVLNLARFTYTSAGYEAGIEALHFKREAKENFYNNFESLNGRAPEQEDIEKFELELNDTANTVFGVNMALVGSSNLVTMGNIFDLKSPIKTGIGDFIDKKAFGYGVSKIVDDAGKISYKTLTPTTAQKVSRNIFSYAKAPITEGLYEEGGQGVTTKVANKWMEYGYNPQNIAENAELSGMLYESLAEQYGTKEGWVENGVGMIIGALGGSINARSGIKQKEQEQQFKADFASNYNQDTLQKTFLQERMITASRVAGFSQEAKEHEQKGNVVQAQIAKTGAIQSFLNGKHAMGEDVMDSVKEVEASLNAVTIEEYKNAGISEENVDAYKSEILEGYKSAAQEFKTNRKYAEYMIGKSKLVGEKDLKSGVLEEVVGKLDTNELAIQSLTWTLTAGQNSNQLMADIRDKISEEVGVEQATTLETISRVGRQKANRKGQITKTVNTHKALTEERDKLVKEIAKLNASPKETEGDKTRGNKIAQANTRLLELTDKIAELEQEVNDFTEELNKQESYSKGLGAIELNQSVAQTQISAFDVFNLEGNIKKFQGLIEGLKTSNPQRAQYLEDLLDEYSQAQELFDTYQATSIMLSSGKIDLKQSNNWLSKLANKGKSMDEITRDWLTDILQKYQTNKVSTIAEKAQVEETVTEEAVEDKKTVKPKAVVVDIEQGLTPIEKYKQRIEKLFKKEYNNLTYIGENYDGLANKKPTQEEIEEYRTLKKEGKTSTVRYRELRQKLSDWKVLDSAVDQDNNSIAQLIDLISQLEQEVQEQDTVDEVTQEDTIYISDEIGASSDIVDYDLAQNVRGHVKVKKVVNTNKYRFAHLKITTLISRLGVEPIVKFKGKTLTSYDLDSLEPGTEVILNDVVFTITNTGAIEVDAGDFSNLSQALNLYIVNTQNTNWSYKDVYEVKGDLFVKKQSDFEESINEEALYDLTENSEITFEIGNEDGWNTKALKKYNSAKDKTQAKKELLKTIKIYLVDSKGRRVSVLKGMREGSTDETMLRIRERALEYLLENPTADKIDLGIKTKVKNLYLGSPQFNIESGAVTNVPFTDRATTQVIATGFIEAGNVTSSREFPEGIDTTFVAKLSKDKKVPFVVVRKGKYNIAYPVSLIKTPNPKVREFDDIMSLNISEQEKVSKINEAIQNNGIQTAKLTFEDISNQDVLDSTRKAFESKQTFISMEEFSSPNYKVENLTADAQINIDLEDLDNAISDAKVRISLEEQDVEVRTTVDTKNDTLTKVENSLNDLALELYKDYTANASTKYVDSKGNILEDTHYTDVFDDSPIELANSQLDKIKNINILRNAFSKKLPNIVKQVLGQDKINEVETLIKDYDFIKSQITKISSQVKSGLNNIC